jgi:hypothetical protein
MMRAVAILGCCFYLCAGIKEYVALAPNDVFHEENRSLALEWVAVEYPEDASSTADVSVTAVRESVPELGAWYGLATGGLADTAKIVGSTLYALNSRDPGHDEIWGEGCCANTLQLYPRDGGISEISLDPVVQKATGTELAHASHTFDMTEIEGAAVALFVVKYHEPLINTSAGAIVGMAMNGSIVPTADGSLSFRLLQEAGTFSTDPSESIFKIQYHNAVESHLPAEQYHENGVQRFTTKSGVKVLAVTHLIQSEVVLFKDPFSYPKSDGGGSILQRFGTPMHFGTDGLVSDRYFGLNPSVSRFNHVHNIFYQAASKSFTGSESLSLFVNSQDGAAAAYEFELNLVDEDSTDDPDDTVFEVDYVSARCISWAFSQGGARPIGNGVFLVMSGSNQTGLHVVDTAGHVKIHPYSDPQTIYDPFIRVLADEVVV